MNRLTERDFDFDVDFVPSYLQSWPIAQALKKLQEYENAEESGALIVLPEVPDVDKKAFADRLSRCFQRKSGFPYPDLGHVKMSDEEIALIDALMYGLTK